MTTRHCAKCGDEVVTGENLGVILYDDHVMLQRRHTDVYLCEGCREGFEDWLDSSKQTD